MTFKEFINISSFTPEELYSGLSYYSEVHIPLIDEIFMSLLFIYAEDITEEELYNLTDDPEIFLFKLSIDNTSKKHVLKMSWIEIIRIMVNSKSYGFLASQELKDVSYRLKKNITNKSFNLIPYEEKVLIFDYLIDSSFDTALVRDYIKENNDKKAELKKEKYSLEVELRATEQRKKEIDISEKADSIKEAIENITKSINFYIEENPGLSRQEATKKKKELELERDKKKEILKEFEQNEDICFKIYTRIEKLKEEIHGVSLKTKKFLGYNIYRNEYHFFRNYPSMLFVKVKIDKKNFEWFCYTKEVNKLKKQFNTN